MGHLRGLRFGVASIAILVLLLAGCGGGGSDGGSPSAGGGNDVVAAPSGLSYASPQSYSVGTQIGALSPTVTGTVTNYSVSPSLPAGLTIDSTSGKVSGTPTAMSAASNYVITASNATGSTTFSLSLTVMPPAPSGLTYSSPRGFIVNLPIAPLSPTVTGQVTNYSVSPALPAGLSIDPASGQITGTPTTTAASTNYFVTATNESGSATFGLSIAILIPPPVSLSYASPQTYIQGSPITALTPSVTGQVSTYSVSPSLPAGLSLDSLSGRISGTPTIASPTTTYTVTAANGTGVATFGLWIMVLIQPPSGLSYPSPPTLTQGSALAPLSPVVTGVVSYYSVQPALPAGLSINPATGQITGTPTTVTPAASYLVTATNSTGTATFSLSITVRLAPPSALTYRSPQTFYVGSAISPLSPSVTGAVGSYAVRPALPAGLALDPVSGLITGTPTTATASSSYVITATNSSGATTFSATIAVVLLPPRALSYPSPQAYAVGEPITPLSPFVIGVVTNYTVAPSLPAGLALDPTTGQISGTPIALVGAATYTVTVANGAGSSSFGLSIAVVPVGVSPANISRIVAAGTPVIVAVSIQAQTLVGALFVSAADPSGVFNPAVTVQSNGNGYTLWLQTSTTIGAGHYSGNVVLTLCRDAACTMPQAPASISVPFDVEMLSAASAWPGNHLTPIAAWPGVPDWNMFQGNAGHTGSVPASVDPNSFTTRWQGGPTLSNTPNNFNGAFAYTLTTDGGQLYIATGTKLYALKELDASQVWSYDVSGLQSPSVNPPAEANATVYMAAGQQSSTYLFAFDEATGAVVFKSPMTSQFEHYFAPTIGAQGIYTNAGTFGGLYGFSFSGNQLFYNGSLGQVSQWTPAVDGTSVYSYTGSLAVSDPVTGNVQETIADPTYQNYEYLIDGSAVLGVPGSVFAADYANAYINGGGLGNHLVAYNTNTQTITWQLSGDYGYNPAYDGGVLYAANNSPLRLEARSETDGSLLWSWTPPQAGDSTFDSEVLLTDSMIFVSTNLATYGIDRLTHQLVFSCPFPGRLALSNNGILYIQGTGPIVAINVK